MSHTKKVTQDTKVTRQNKEVALGFEPKPICFHQLYKVVLVPKPNQTKPQQSMKVWSRVSLLHLER